jgi:osmoprotectant transport system substrate-binding protein
VKSVLRSFAAVAAISALGVAVAACGSSKPTSSSSTSSTAAGGGAKETINITSANFSEDTLVAYMYADALKKAGYTVNTGKLNLGTREVYLKAMQNGEVDLVPDYVGSLSQQLNTDENGPNANTTSPVASSDLTATSANASRLADKVGLKLLTPSPAADQNGYGVSQATATKDHLTSLAQISSFSSGWTFGGPPECQTRPDCLPGLQSTYGAKFGSFKALDAGGPLTLAALVNGSIQIGVVFTSDGTAAADHIVILDDPKHVAPVDNIVGLIRKSKSNADVDAIINKVDAALTTDELRSLNEQIGVNKADPATLAQQFDSTHGLA